MQIKIPKGETVAVTYYNKNKTPDFLITKNNKNDCFIMYSIGTDLTLTKLGKSKSPSELENKFKKDKAANMEKGRKRK